MTAYIVMNGTKLKWKHQAKMLTILYCLIEWDKSLCLPYTSFLWRKEAPISRLKAFLKKGFHHKFVVECVFHSWTHGARSQNFLSKIIRQLSLWLRFVPAYSLKVKVIVLYFSENLINVTYPLVFGVLYSKGTQFNCLAQLSLQSQHGKVQLIFYGGYRLGGDKFLQNVCKSWS